MCWLQVYANIGPLFNLKWKASFHHSLICVVVMMKKVDSEHYHFKPLDEAGHAAHGGFIWREARNW